MAHDPSKLTNFPERHVVVGEESTPVIVETSKREQHANMPTVEDVKEIAGKTSYSKTEIDELLEQKQDVLTFDNVPTEDSDNPVKSGGVYTALGDKQDKLTEELVESGSVAQMMGFDSEGNVVRGTVPSGSVIDSELDDESTNPVENQAITKGIEGVRSDLLDGTLVPNKALTSEQLENVSEESGTTQEEPFVFQATGTDGGFGSTDTAPVAKQLSYRGKTYAFNQFVKNGNFSNGTTDWNCQNGTISASSNILTYTITTVKNDIAGNRIDQSFTHSVGHIYLFKFSVKCPHTTPVRIYLNGFQLLGNATENTWTDFAVIITNSNVNNYANNMIYFECQESNGYAVNDTIQIKNCSKYDLTLMFNGNVPDEILNGIEDLGGVDGLDISGIAIFNQLFPEPYYAYNEGTLVSGKASKLITIGYNQFDGEMEQGAIDATTGEDTADNRFIRGDFIKVIPGQTYSLEQSGTINSDDYGQRNIYEYDENKNFIKRNNQGNNISLHTFDSPYTRTLTDNTHYIRLCYYNRTYTVENVAFHLTWDASRTGYEPYVKHEYNLPNVELHSAGDVYDEIKPDGTKIVRVGTVDLGTLTWYAGSNNRFSCYVSSINNFKTPNANNVKANMLCAKYTTYSADDFSVNQQDKSISCPSGSGVLITIRDTNSAYTDAATFKTAMSGVMLYYELTEPVESQSTSYTENIEVDDFGTMEFDSTYPQGNAFFYPADYVLFIDTLYESVNGDAGSLAKKSYVTEALASFLSSITGYDATKTQTLKNVQGVFTWVDDE